MQSRVQAMNIRRVRRDCRQPFAEGAEAVRINTAATSDNLTVSGAIGGNNTSATLTKNGAGTVTLSATNTYVGNTTVNAGTLALTAAGADSTGSLTINTGGVVTVSTTTTGAGTSNGSALGGGGVTLSGGTLQNANLTASPATGATPQGNNIQNGGALTLTSGTTSYLDFGLGNTGAVFNFTGLSIHRQHGGDSAGRSELQRQLQRWDERGDGVDQFFIGTNNTTLTQAQLADIQFVNPAGYSGTVSASQLMDGEISPAPEPGEVATLSMMGLGLGGLILRARKRRMAETTAA